MEELKSRCFEVERLRLRAVEEPVVRGGRDRFDRLARAFEGVERIGVIGWGSQGPAQAQNLRDSLRGTGIRVTVGLRASSASRGAAREAGFDEADGTLGEMFEVIRTSDLVILLISDASQVELADEIFAALAPGATLGLSHGFLLGHLESLGRDFPEDVNVIAVCPKGMGPSVRSRYLEAEHDPEAGIHCSVAIHRDRDGRATDLALGWAIALGAPWVFRTTLRSELHSDLVGERGVLLGGLHGVVESLYRRCRALGDAPDEAFRRACGGITGPLTRRIAESGLRGVVTGLSVDERSDFARSFACVHPAALGLLHELYDEVESGNELRGVVAAGRRLHRFPMGCVEGGEMWQVGARLREGGTAEPERCDAFAAGVYCAVMTAQIDVLLERGHPASEVVNESVIEAVDSLTPAMRQRGVGYMVDSCSTTARLGARKWGPRFEALLVQQCFPEAERSSDADAEAALETFVAHPIHELLERVAGLRSTPRAAA